ncbi:unnamed protein product [Rangifer tarandus platyrhynchus]|uniref:Uncharacterized protein n=2 Tax=Rangifer tarandus platyrhynchus TaxID=3082113 RepID=A0ACB0DX06_RANTA|nr:unnamed protein product [Rangifer tarandus platyrhynchus]CAI9692828.1 unnamed protein product [Rangifer tarandus platyrhynchus]
MLLPRRQSQSSGARAEQASPIDSDQLGYRPAGLHSFAGCRESGRAVRQSFARAPYGPAPSPPHCGPLVPGCPRSAGLPSTSRGARRDPRPGSTSPGGFGGWNVVRTPAFPPPSTAASKLDFLFPSIDRCIVRMWPL